MVQDGPHPSLRFAYGRRIHLPPVVVSLAIAVLASLLVPADALSSVDFRPPQAYSVGSTNSPSEMTSGDFDGDGRVDIATVNISTGFADFSVLYGRGDGSFVQLASMRLTDGPHR